MAAPAKSKVKGLYLRGKTWWAGYRAPVLDAEGLTVRNADGTCQTTIVYKSTGAKLKKMAEPILARWRGAAEETLAAPDLHDERVLARKAREARQRQQELTLEGLRDRWLEHAQRKKSLADDRTRLDRVVAILGPDVRAADLRREDVERLVAELERTPPYVEPEDGQRKRGQKKPVPGTTMSPASINRHLAALRAALNLARRDGLLENDPMAGVRLAKEHARDRVCSPQELERLLEASSGPLRLAIAVGYFTGMRLGEIAGLRWAQVDLEGALVRLHGSETKTGEGRRVPLAPAAVEALRAEQERQRAEGQGRAEVFDLARATISSAFSKLTRSLGIEDLRFHDLRHTALTNLRRGGADVFTLAAISGHRDLAMLRRYQNFRDEDLHEAIKNARS